MALAVALSLVVCSWLWRVVWRRRRLSRASMGPGVGARLRVRPYLQPKPELHGDGKYELSANAETMHSELDPIEVVEVPAGAVGSEIDGSEVIEMPAGIVGNEVMSRKTLT